ncbi:MAG: ParB N-terminal domain-containing protein [Desulfovibrio sp.]
MTTEQQEGQSLDALARELFGDAATFRVADPATIRLRKENARYFKKDVFKQLVDNVKSDGMLSSMPLCYEPEPGVLEVLSGNHRVKAAVAAGIPRILVMVLLGELDESRLTSIQLSHNALVGLDDPQVLASLWAKIRETQDRLYAGLSSDALGEMEKVKLVTFSTPSLATRTMTFAFVDTDAAQVAEVLDALAALPKSATVHAAPLEMFDSFFASLQQAKVKADVKNSALAMTRLIEFAAKAMEDAA